MPHPAALVLGGAMAQQQGARGRDRHGRGIRGPLAPPTSPATRTRGERFGDLVLDAVDRLRPRWSPYLDAVDVEVVDVPSPQDVEALGGVPLAGHREAAGARPASLVVYRRPVELRAKEPAARRDLVRDLVAEELADLIGIDPADLDPDYDDPGADQP